MNECHRANDLRVESQGQDEGQGQDQGQGQGQGHWGGVEPSSYNYFYGCMNFSANIPERNNVVYYNNPCSLLLLLLLLLLSDF